MAPRRIDIKEGAQDALRAADLFTRDGFGANVARGTGENFSGAELFEAKIGRVGSVNLELVLPQRGNRSDLGEILEQEAAHAVGGVITVRKKFQRIVSAGQHQRLVGHI